MEIKWSQLAKETLSSILVHVEDNFSRSVAQKVNEKIINHVDLLSYFPRIGVKDEKFSDDRIEVRYVINTPNIIYYGIIEDVIVIISVFDTRRSPVTINTVVRKYLQQHK